MALSSARPDLPGSTVTQTGQTPAYAAAPVHSQGCSGCAKLAVALGRRTDKVFRAIRNDIGGTRGDL
jgi:hypothetical protein